MVPRAMVAGICVFTCAISGARAQSARSASGTVAANQLCQASRACGRTLSVVSAPISRAKRSAPVPTRNSCGRRSSTARAMETGCRKPCTAPTAPVRSVLPSIIAASSSTSPRMLAQPPRPDGAHPLVLLDQADAGLDRVERRGALREHRCGGRRAGIALVVGDQDHAPLLLRLPPDPGERDAPWQALPARAYPVPTRTRSGR